MFTRTFRTIRKLLGPRWLTEGEGELVGYSLDLVKDAFLERARLGMLAGFPENGPNGETAPEDALVLMGRDRKIVRGIGESSADYAVRLKNWLVAHRTRGNPYTLMRTLAAYTGSADGCSFRTVDARGNWYSRAADGTESAALKTGNWQWDDMDPSRWSRFWVIIYPGTLWIASAYDWGDTAGPGWGEYVGTFDSAATLGSTITNEQAATLRALVSVWKPDGTRCVNIILAFDPASFDPASPEPDGLWGHWSKVVLGVRVPARLSTARYLDGG